jgi:hypothetical protein
MGQFRYPVVLFISSLLALSVGLLFRIMHWPGGGLITGAMFMVQGIAIIWLIVLLLRAKK